MAYKVITGFNYPDDDNRNDENPAAEVRVEAGTTLDSLPPKYAQGIIDLGCVEEIVVEEIVIKEPAADGLTTGPLVEPKKKGGR